MLIPSMDEHLVCSHQVSLERWSDLLLAKALVQILVEMSLTVLEQVSLCQGFALICFVGIH